MECSGSDVIEMNVPDAAKTLSVENVSFFEIIHRDWLLYEKLPHKRSQRNRKRLLGSNCHSQKNT